MVEISRSVLSLYGVDLLDGVWRGGAEPGVRGCQLRVSREKRACAGECGAEVGAIVEECAGAC